MWSVWIYLFNNLNINFFWVVDSQTCLQSGRVYWVIGLKIIIKRDKHMNEPGETNARIVMRKLWLTDGFNGGYSVTRSGMLS